MISESTDLRSPNVVWLLSVGTVSLDGVTMGHVLKAL
jgi:hypothetical protein